jgi:hypothetical protein
VSEFKIYSPRGESIGAPGPRTHVIKDVAGEGGQLSEVRDEDGNLIETKRVIDDPARAGRILTFGTTCDGCRYIVQGHAKDKPQPAHVQRKSWADEDVDENETTEQTVSVYQRR